ncbi:hypothetical protein [Liquorilactobacillus satsumensis]|uniref:hypothetical protein n=1 Tax=Liquorilactobacillus satsumensis TaxID=259059 RepID=UPI0039EC9F91
MKTPLSQVQPDDLNKIKEICNTDHKYTYNTNNGYLTLDSQYDNSGAIVASSVAKANVENGHFNLNVNPSDPVLKIQDNMGDTLGTYTLSTDQLKDQSAGITVKTDLLQQAESNSDGNDDSDQEGGNDPVNGISLSSSSHYPYQHNGKKYEAGIHVNCNDFLMDPILIINIGVIMVRVLLQMLLKLLWTLQIVIVLSIYLSISAQWQDMYFRVITSVMACVKAVQPIARLGAVDHTTLIGHMFCGIETSD